MADIVSGIDGTLHCTDGQLLDQVLFALALHLGEEPVHRIGQPLARLHLQGIAELAYEVVEGSDLILQRLVMHTIDERLGLRTLRHLADEFGHLFVGQQHVFLHQTV